MKLAACCCTAAPGGTQWFAPGGNARRGSGRRPAPCGAAGRRLARETPKVETRTVSSRARRCNGPVGAGLWGPGRLPSGDCLRPTVRACPVDDSRKPPLVDDGSLAGRAGPCCRLHGMPVRPTGVRHRNRVRVDPPPTRCGRTSSAIGCLKAAVHRAPTRPGQGFFLTRGRGGSALCSHCGTLGANTAGRYIGLRWRAGSIQRCDA